MTPLSFTFTGAERRLFANREILPGSVWASRHLIVQDGLYAGSPMRLDVAPFLSGPLDVFTTPGVQETIICGSLQVGKTLILNACLGWCMDYRPGIKMVTLPTKQTIEKVARLKLHPLLKGSPVLRRMVDKYLAFSIKLKDGTSILMASAETPSDRASITVQDLVVDEEDLYGAGGLSNPLEDFKGRTTSYGDYAKIVRGCQIKGGEESSIWRGITREAEILFCYEVQCPACRRRHLPEVDKIVVPCGEKDPRLIRARRLARYGCACNYHWSDHIRDLAVANGGWQPYRYTPDTGFVRMEGLPGLQELLGRWQSGKEDPPKSVGFHIPAIISRFVSLSHIAARRLSSAEADDPDALRQYYNDDLALPYTPVEMQTDAEKLLDRVDKGLPPGVVPHGAVALTCGIDTQKRGFYYTVLAWMPNLTSYVVDYGQLASFADVHRLVYDACYPVLASGADTTGIATPEAVAALRVSGSPLLTGELMPIWRAGIDSGGGDTDDGVYTRTEEVYLWVRANSGGLVFACKGASRAQVAPVRRTIVDRLPRSGKPLKRGGLTLFILDTDHLKRVVFKRLLDDEARTKLHFHCATNAAFTEQIAAEKLMRKGQKMVWERVRKDNHYLDCVVLATACADASWTPSLPHMLIKMHQQSTTPEGQE